MIGEMMDGKRLSKTIDSRNGGRLLFGQHLAAWEGGKISLDSHRIRRLERNKGTGILKRPLCASTA